jgi:fluoride exporter
VVGWASVTEFAVTTRFHLLSRWALPLAIALGSGLGGVARVAIGLAVGSPANAGIPFAILAVNTMGSLLIGAAAALFTAHGGLHRYPIAHPFFMAGFCGGFTTFSVFSLQTLQLLRAGQAPTAILYAALTLGLAIAAVWVGHRIGLRCNRRQ